MTERVLLATGLLMCCLFAIAQLDSSVASNGELLRFERARDMVSAEIPVDRSLWSENRIEAHRRSLEADVGLPLAVLAIPKIGLEVPVLKGTSELTLNRGVGHIEGTPRPGEPGNVAIAGHRDGFFRGLKDLDVGDRIVLTTLHERQFFVIQDLRVVDPGDVYVLDPTPSPTLTLVTCYPFYFVGSAPQRFVVTAVEARQAATPSAGVTMPWGAAFSINHANFTAFSACACGRASAEIVNVEEAKEATSHA